MVEKFRKKPVEVEAIQWNGNSNLKEIEEFVNEKLKYELENDTAYELEKGPQIFSLLIETKEGVMKATKGDWIIKEPFPTKDRKFYPCKEEFFEKTYEKLKTEEQETCEYCQLEKPLIIRTDDYDILKIVGIKENNLKLKIDGDGFTEEEINYCPKCGRKFKGEKDTVEKIS